VDRDYGSGHPRKDDPTAPPLNFVSVADRGLIVAVRASCRAKARRYIWRLPWLAVYDQAVVVVEVDGIGVAGGDARLAALSGWFGWRWRLMDGLRGLCWGSGIGWRRGSGRGGFRLGGLGVGPLGEEVAGDCEGGFGLRRSGAGIGWGLARSVGPGPSRLPSCLRASRVNKPGPYRCSVRRLRGRLDASRQSWNWLGFGGVGFGSVEVGVNVGVGRGKVFVVGIDGVADGVAPAVGAEGVDVFMLGEVDGLELGLEHVGDGAGEAGFDVAADDGGDEAAEGGAEIAGGEVFAREEVVEIFGERFGGLRLGFFLGVVEAEVGMVADAWGAAAAAIGETE